jgi:predicted TIM-barrel fold metal-dependent hydrolase
MDLNRFDWLCTRQELALEPELEIVDPHHHLWDRGGSTYLAEQLANDISSGHRVVQTVFVDCMSKYDRSAKPHLQSVGETVFVARQAERLAQLSDARLSAIVGFADLTSGVVLQESLEAHLAASSLFRGVRHATGWDASDGVPSAHTKPSAGLTSSIAFIDGARALAMNELSLDAWLYHTQLPELTTLARAVPRLTVILNHLGAPLGIGPYASRRIETLQLWRRNMAELAACENVFVKLGGFGLDDYFGMGWTAYQQPPDSGVVANHWGDEVRWCIDTFGPSRCMFESNYPVDRQSLTYVVLWNACKLMSRSYSLPEREALFSGTARRAYRLAPWP